MLLSNCTPSTPVTAPATPSEVLVELFPIADDTIEVFHFYNNQDEIENPLPDSLLKNALSEDIISEMEYGTGYAKYKTNIQIPLDEKYAACIMDGAESWYRNQSLLIYDKSVKAFKDIMTVSQFYGGDGGQIVTESWIYTENNKRYLYKIESSHAIMPTGDSDEIEEFLEQHGYLYIWNGGTFEKTAQEDSLALAKRFKMKWEW